MSLMWNIRYVEKPGKPCFDREQLLHAPDTYLFHGKRMANGFGNVSSLYHFNLRKHTKAKNV